MRSAHRYAVAVAAAALLVGIFGLTAARLDRQSVAQVVVEPIAPKAVPLPPAPILDVPGLMRLFNKPLYTSLQEKTAQQPAAPEEWKNLEALGLQAAEIANLVALRPVEPQRQAWRQATADLQQAGVALADAAKAQQWDGAHKAYLSLIQACNNCHQARAPKKAPELKP